MKILLVNGSPKSKNSASEVLEGALCERLGNSHQYVKCHAIKTSAAQMQQAAEGCAAIVILFPLYVDGLPSHLLRLLEEVKEGIAKAAPGAKVYGVANNGFIEGQQNRLALQVLENFCAASGLLWGQGLGIGGGGMVGTMPFNKGPLKNIGLALETLAANISALKTAPNIYTQPNFPRFLYIMAAHIGWRSMGKKNGLRAKQLHNKL